MELTDALRAEPLGTPMASTVVVSQSHHGSTSGVSWAAILAGAGAAASLSLILLMLGVGLGLSSISPWNFQGVSAKTLGWSSILWVVFTQIAASAIGGYLAGRLRLKWLAVHSDEVYFRDTAHGFLAWSVATLLTAATLTSAVGAIVGGGVQAGAQVARPEIAANPGNYYVDSLFRGAAPTAPDGAQSPQAQLVPAAAPTAEVTAIFANGVRSGEPLPAADVEYIARLVSERTGLSAADAQKRVTDTYASFQNGLDATRRVFAYAALWLFVALLCGAFVASVAATVGGRQRDR